MKNKQQIWEEALDQSLTTLGYNPQEVYSKFSAIANCSSFSETRLSIAGGNSTCRASLEIRVNYQGALPMPMGSGNLGYIEKLFEETSEKTGLKFKDYQSSWCGDHTYEADTGSLINKLAVIVSDGRIK